MTTCLTIQALHSCRGSVVACCDLAGDNQGQWFCITNSIRLLQYRLLKIKEMRVSLSRYS